MKQIIIFLFTSLIWGCSKSSEVKSRSSEPKIFSQFSKTDSKIIIKQKGYDNNYETTTLSSEGSFIWGITDKKNYKKNENFYGKLFLINKDLILKGDYKIYPKFKFGSRHNGPYKIILIKDDTAYIEDKVPDTLTTKIFKWSGKFNVELPTGDTTFFFEQELLLEK